MLDSIAKSVSNRLPWFLLFLSAFALEVTALYFQYAMELLPCIMCIYQRTAMLGIVFAGLLPTIVNTKITRFIAFVTWGISSIWGFLIAKEHVDIQTALNPFFASCEIVPNFPSFMPLHDWIPSFFAATGDCGDIDWQFFDISMPQWMMVIFGIYSVLFVVVLFARLLRRHQF